MKFLQAYVTNLVVEGYSRLGRCNGMHDSWIAAIPYELWLETSTLNL